MSFQMGAKKRRVVKGSIGSPADFRHSGHIGPSNIHLVRRRDVGVLNPDRFELTFVAAAEST